MAEIHPLIPAGIIVPLAEFRMVTDAMVSLHQAVAHLTAMLIDRLDGSEPDSDLEDNGDREASDGDSTDVAWPEWDQLRAHDKRADFERPVLAAGNGCHGMTEDDEEDDPHGQCDEDGINTALVLGKVFGAGCMIADDDMQEPGPVPTYGIDQTCLLNRLGEAAWEPAPDFLPDASDRDVV